MFRSHAAPQRAEEAASNVLSRYFADLSSRSPGSASSSASASSEHPAGWGWTLGTQLAHAWELTHPETRTKASQELRALVEGEVRDLSTEAATRFLDDLTNRVFDLVNSADVHEKLGGIAVIDELIEVKSEVNETMIIRFANAFRILFQQSTSHGDPIVLASAAKALGHLARAGGALTVEFVEFQIKQSLEWLQSERNERRHLAAVLVLRELAQNTPTLFNVYVDEFLVHIWVALRDPKEEIREASVEALRVCLRDIAKRGRDWRQACYGKLFNESLAGFAAKKPAVHTIHGSLLCVGELLNIHPPDFMADKFRDTCENVLRYRDHSNGLIVRTVISLIPRLAALSPSAFSRSYLSSCLAYLIEQMKDSPNRDIAFLALGELAQAVGEGIVPQLDVIVAHVSAGLTPRKAGGAAGGGGSGRGSKRRNTATAMVCVGMLAKALGVRMLPYTDRLVDLMFHTGLTPLLIDALGQFSEHIPSVSSVIQERLLDSISGILIRPFLPVAAPGTVPERVPFYGCPPHVQIRRIAPGAVATASKSRHMRGGGGGEHLHHGQGRAGGGAAGGGGGGAGDFDPALIILALSTLHQFPFNYARQHSLVGLLRNVVLAFLDDEIPYVRKEAALTCAKLIPRIIEAHGGVTGPAGQGGQSGVVSRPHTTLIMFEVLKRLIIVGIADPIPSIRVTVLSSLDPRIDKYLAQVEILQALFAALNDESFAVREVVITLLGRLSARNPAFVLPTLRRILLQLLGELQEFHGNGMDQEESSKLLGHLIGSSHQLIKPYVDPILNVLVPKLTNMDARGVFSSSGGGGKGGPGSSGGLAHVGSGVASYVLSTLGKLSAICGEDMLRFLDGLLPLIIDALQDRSGGSIKRQVALRTLGQLMSSTGYVIEPALKYPTLLPTILQVLRAERNSAMRVEVLKVLGVLGAIDPHRYRLAQLAHRNKMEGGAAGGGGSQGGGGRDGGAGAGNPDSSYTRLPAGGAGAGNVASAATKAAGGGVGGAGAADSNDSDTIFPWQTQSPEDYYPTVAIDALMRILSDPRLSSHHNMVLHAVMFIFRSLSLKCVPFLPQIMPPFLREIRTCEEALREAFLQHMCSIVSIVKHHIRPYLEPIFQMCMDYWHEPALLIPILNLLEELCLSLGDEFKSQLPALISRFISVFSHDPSEHRMATMHVLHALRVVASARAGKGNLDDYLHIVLPALVRLCENPEELLHVRVATVTTISAIASTHDIAEHASRIIHPFSRILAATNSHAQANALVSPTGSGGPNAAAVAAAAAGPGVGITPATLYNECLDVLCKLILQLGFGYIVFEPIIRNSLSRVSRHHVDKIESMQHLRYQRIVDRLLAKVAQVREQMTRADQRGGERGLYGAGMGGGAYHNAVAASVGGGANYPGGGGGGVGGLPPSSAHSSHHPSHLPQPHQNLLLTPDLESYHDFKLICFTQGIDLNDLDDFPSPPEEERPSGLDAASQNPDGVSVKKLHVSQQNLMKSWAASHRSTNDDWVVWMRGFSIELLKESPSSALRACSALAQKHPPLAKELFNAAFLSCWSELEDRAQDDLLRSLETTFRSPHIPTEIMQTLLNIAEFMEHQDLPLPLDVRLLGDLAERCHAHAKALHYKERAFRTSPASALESLISINNKLGQADAARGMLEYAHQYHPELMQESWYEKLGRWEDAVEAYEIKQMDNPSSVALTLGRMRCVRALGDWPRLEALSRDAWNRCSAPQIRAQISPLAAAAALNLHAWDSLERFLPHMDENVAESAFYRAILSIHRGDFSMATDHIDRACEMLDSSLTALVGESYHRAYGTIVKVQQLMELQEVISYKQGNEEKKHLIRKMWSQRLKGCQRSVEVWQEILSVRALVISPREDIDTWLDFSTLCRKSGRLHLSLQVLTNLLGMDPTLFVLNPDTPLPVDHPQMTLACLKHLYAAGYEKEAYNRLCDLVNSETLNPDLRRIGDTLTPLAVERLKATCYLKLGTWQMEMLDSYFLSHEFHGPKHLQALMSAGMGAGAAGGNNPNVAALLAKNAEQKALKARQYAAVIPQVLNYFHAATVCDMSSFRAWHEWAMMNFRVVKFAARASNQAAGRGGGGGSTSGSPNISPLNGSINSGNGMTKHIVASIEGFFRSIWLQAGGDNSRQDVLRLLALWFEHGSIKEVEAALSAGLFGAAPDASTAGGSAAGGGNAGSGSSSGGSNPSGPGATRQGCISIDTWLAVIPQLIARIHSPSPAIRNLLHELLSRIGRAHPQALVYPLTVASKSYSEVRKSAALSILNQMRQHSNSLVNQALLVSSELVRVAILWHELWHEGIEEASRYWFGQKNVDAMLSTLAPLHAMMDRGPSTMREVAFQQSFGRELQEAQNCCIAFNKSGRTQMTYLNKAWELYGEIFRKITAKESEVTELELDEVSPNLLRATHMQLAVPGMYRVGVPIVCISFFKPTLKILPTKQHPRRLALGGSDGVIYDFLLKGHEDLRQDERVMQLFGLVNTFLAIDRATAKIELGIARYAVIPLSPNSGLIEWVPACDTVHAVIKQYRDARKILLNIEQRLMIKLAPDYQHLTLIQKVEVFEYTLASTSGHDLRKALWLKSPSAEQWLDRRVNLTRSLAVMSMVGYILGLGDRHPCNFMVERERGRIVHIDFGDCFEVACHREKYPEKVPFRLTRMLVNAMEVSGIDGTFRSTCETVMHVLRKNKNSVMAVLEAFVHDPLINWRLLETANKDEKATPPAASATGGKAGDDHKEGVAAGAAAAPAHPRLSKHDVVVGSAVSHADRRRSVVAIEQQEDLLQAAAGEVSGEASNAAAASTGINVPAASAQAQAQAQAAAAVAAISVQNEQLNDKAVAVIARVESKLKGTDFLEDSPTNQHVLDVSGQVQRLIIEATSHINLCQSYIDASQLQPPTAPQPPSPSPPRTVPTAPALFLLPFPASSSSSSMASPAPTPAAAPAAARPMASGRRFGPPVPVSVLTDSYKASHFLMYPEAQLMVAYGEFRVPFQKDKEDTRFVFAGMRYLIENYVSIQWTEEDVEASAHFYATHNAGFQPFPFPKDLFLKFVRENNGYFPVRIEALPEGTVANIHVPVYQIFAEKEYARLITFLETILTQVWYPSTVATLSRRTRDLVEEGFRQTADEDVSWMVDYKLHDFGFRGCCSVEQSIIGGCAHLLNFSGSDTMSACYYAQYHLNGGKPVATSIPATEHSVMTSWANERQAMANMIDKFGGEGHIFAVVMDSYDYENALTKVLPAVAKSHMKKGGTMVLRPDSGDPVECILDALKAGEKNFPTSLNGKGYKVIQGLAAIQGDGINYNTVKAILAAVQEAGFSAQNVAFGMGGGLLQRVNRDTMSFATKLSYIRYADGSAREVMKRPKTDGGKLSLPGVLKVRREGGKLWVEPRKPDEAHDPATNELKVVYDYGPVAGVWDDFETVRARVKTQWAATPKQHDPVSPAMHERIAQWIRSFDVIYAHMMKQIEVDAAAAAAAVAETQANGASSSQADQHQAQEIQREIKAQAQGCCSVEQSIIGGCAHLLNFSGSDTMSACYYAQYHLNGGKPVATSIPATEHSVMTSWANERQAMANMIDKFGGP